MQKKVHERRKVLHKDSFSPYCAKISLEIVDNDEEKREEILIFKIPRVFESPPMLSKQSFWGYVTIEWEQWG